MIVSRSVRDSWASGALDDEYVLGFWNPHWLVSSRFAPVSSLPLRPKPLLSFLTSFSGELSKKGAY